MPISSVQDTRDVEQALENILNESDNQARISHIKYLLEEKLDFEGADQLVSLTPANSDQLPTDAHIVGRRSGVTVAYIPLGNANTNRVTAAVAIAATRTLTSALDDQLLLLFTNRDGDQLHIISPDLTGSRPKLQRLVAYRDQVQRTVPQQIANLWNSYGVQGKTMGQAIEEAFSVEPVTEEFFKAYRNIFNNAKAEISGFGNSNEEQEAKHVFTQTLFNRLMFVYFLSRKGWLKFKGDTDYLKALWRDYGSLAGDHNFYTARAETLFFAGLNNPQSRDVNKGNEATLPVIGPVPFLNGGLFERTDLDRRVDITVPDDVIKRILTDLFDRFNFTVMESTPFDVEVAVDPEMLGKVFEELVTERHASGAYYTPRPVVSFMCREALKGYLEGKETGASTEAIAAFVDRHDTEGIGVAEARSISRALEEVTVVDPACGSGAYLLGMMQELVELQNTLYNVGVDDKSLYELKLEIIQRNLYGVDIDDFAVNIAMLRLWLSLAIDFEIEKEGDDPPPLPNLDFKVLCGDSLLGPDPSAGVEVQGTLGQDIEQFRKLGELKGKYMRAFDGNEKVNLRGEIRETEDGIREALGAGGADEGVIDWRVEFAEVFAERHGFDVAIANPPYVVVKDAQLRSLYSDGVFGRMNLYGLFIQRCLQLLTAGGQLAFINPRTLLTDRYFTNLRKVIKRQAKLKGVVLIGDRHNTFDRVLQECIILHLAVSKNPATGYLTNTRRIQIPADLNNHEDFVPVATERVLLSDDYDGAFYIGSSEFEYEVFERMKNAGLTLADFGLKAETGKVQFDKYKEFARPTKSRGACRLIWAENVQRYTTRPSRVRVGKEWLSRGITSALAPNIRGTGIVTQRVSANEQPRRIIATLINSADLGANSVYSENHTNFVPLPRKVNAKFLLGVLNSSVVEFIFRHLNSNTQVSAGEINSLPFPPVPEANTLAQIEALVSEVMALGGVDAAPASAHRALGIERELDVLIGSLYGFTAEEVEQVQEMLPLFETVYGVGD